MTRFDSLVHVTRDGRWLNGRHDASYERLIAELERGSVERACLVGLAGIVDNEYVLECARKSARRLVPIAGFDPIAHSELAALHDTLSQYARDGFAGIKLHPRLNRYDPLAASCIETIRAATTLGLVVFLDTLFRQNARSTHHAADIVDRLAHECPGAQIVLLHAGGPAALEMAEVVRLHPTLLLDLSFTLPFYAGSSLDADLRWLMERLDQRIVVGSDMPEYTPSEVFTRFEQLADRLPVEKLTNMSHRNLERLFARSAMPAV